MNRRFTLEPLEQRRLLTVDMPLGLPMSTFVGPLAANAEGQLIPPGAYTATATPGQLPATELINLSPLPATSVQPGATDVVMSDLLGWSPTGSYAQLDALIAVPAQGSAPFDGNVDHFSLWGDLDGRSDNGYETLLDTASPSGDVVIFEGFSRGVFVGRGHYPAFQIHADMSDSLSGDFLGVEVATAEFSDLRGKPFADHRISYVGEPTLFPIETINGELTIVERQQAMSDTVVTNQKNVPLLRFDAIASGADVLVTDFSFVAEQGNLNNATNYSFWVDTNGDGTVDTVLQHGVAAQQGRVTFSILANGGYVVPQSEFPTAFEIHGDIASSPASDNTLQLDFAATDAVMAELTANGNSLETDGIHLDASGESILYTIFKQGDLFVQKSSTPVRSQYLLGGTLVDTALRLTVHAEREPISVTRLSFTLSDTAALQDVDSLELYKPGEVTPFVTATRGQTIDGIGHFTSTMTGNQLVVGEGQDQDILVRPRIKSDEAGSASGHTFSVSVARVEAQGLVSGNTIAQNDGDAVAEGEVIIGRSTPSPNQAVNGSTHTISHSKIVSITNANPNPDGTSIPTGHQPIGQFKVTAAPHANTKNGSNDVILDSIEILVGAHNVAVATDGFALYNKANFTVRSTSYTLKPLEGQSINGPTISGAFSVIFTGLDVNPVDTAIGAGEDATFVLEMNVVNPKVQNTFSSLFAGFWPSTTEWFDRDTFESVHFTDLRYPENVVWSTLYNV